MTDPALCYLSATEALRRFRDRSLSPVELTEALIARAEAVNPAVNAFTEVFAERAIKAARKAEARYMRRDGRRRRLEGLPLAVKEIHALKGEVTTYASRLYVGQRDTETLLITDRALKAGAILFARSTSPELGAAVITHSPLWGVTRNPWNTAFSPGGSGGGGAAALAAGMATIADGSDYGGSIRVPASCCGVFGFKPPYGRNPKGPPENLDPFSHYGALTRTVADGALVQNVMSGPDPRDIMSIPRRVTLPLAPGDIAGWKVGWSMDLGYVEVDPDVRRNTLAALDAFRDLGCTVEEVDVGWSDEVYDAFVTHSTAGFAAGMAEDYARGGDLMSSYAAAVVERGLKVTAQELAQSDLVRSEMYGKLGPLLHRYDVLVCPTTAVPSVAADHDPLDRSFTVNGRPVRGDIGWCLTYPFNMLGQCPVASVPSGFSGDGVPTGIQIVARPQDDVRVFRAAYAYERIRPWLDASDRRPALP